MVQIVNDDQLCMARAIGVGLAKKCLVSEDDWDRTNQNARHLSNLEILLKHRQTNMATYKHLRTKGHREQKHLALLLCRAAGVPDDKPGSLNDLPKFEEALRIRIAVVAASLGNKFVRIPDNEHEDWPLIYLYLVDTEGVSHFHAIVSIVGFFSARYFCERCFKQYDHNTEHRCATTCLTCKSSDCPETDAPMSCRECHMVCRSLACFERHVTPTTAKNGEEVKKSQCEKYWRCTTCKKVVNREERSETKHQCSEWLCKCCRSWVTGNHRCFLFPEEPKEPVQKFIFFDFEATQDQLAQCSDGYAPARCPDCPEDKPCAQCRRCRHCSKTWCGQPRHVPNFVVAQTTCSYCEDETLEDWPTCQQCGTRCPECDTFDKDLDCYVSPPCRDTCGRREVAFQGDSTLDDFGAWLFSPQHKDATVLAHNMKVIIPRYYPTG